MKILIFIFILIQIQMASAGDARSCVQTVNQVPNTNVTHDDEIQVFHGLLQIREEVDHWNLKNNRGAISNPHSGEYSAMIAQARTMIPDFDHKFSLFMQNNFIKKLAD